MAGFGLSDAVNAFFDARDAQTERQFRGRVRASQTKQMDRQDAELEAENAARAAGAAVLERYKQAHQQGLQGATPNAGPAAIAPPAPAATTPQPAAAPIGLDGAAPAPVAPATAAPPAPGATTPGLTAAAAPATPYQPSPQHLLDAYDARTTELAKRGMVDQWAQSWAKGADLRQHLRGQALTEAEAQYRQTGDPTAFLKVYPYVADGYDIVKTETGQRQDGEPMYIVTRRNQATGQEERVPMTKEQILDAARFAQDPKAVRELEAKVAMEQVKGMRKIAEEQALEAVRGPGRVRVAEIHAGATRDAATTRADATVKAAGLSADARVDAATVRGGAGGAGGNKVQKTTVDADGFIVNVFKDGSSKRLLLDGKPVKSGEYSKRVDSLVNQLRKSSAGFGKSETELRTQAETSLAGGGEQPKPSTTGKDFSRLWN